METDREVIGGGALWKEMETDRQVIRGGGAYGKRSKQGGNWGGIGEKVRERMVKRGEKRDSEGPGRETKGEGEKKKERLTDRDLDFCCRQGWYWEGEENGTFLNAVLAITLSTSSVPIIVDRQC